jgi:hypothetical protein
VNCRLAAKLTEMAGDQPVDTFVESLVNTVLEDLVDDVRFDGQLPVVPVPPGLGTVTTEEVSHLVDA